MRDQERQQTDTPGREEMGKKREETLPPSTQRGSNKVPELFREFIGDGTKVTLENRNTSPPCDMGSIGPS